MTHQGTFPPGEQVQIYFCAICNGPGSTRHHLAPVATKMPYMGIIRLCPRCHKEVHYYFSNWELAVKFNSLESLTGELKTRRAWPIPAGRARYRIFNPAGPKAL